MEIAIIEFLECTVATIIFVALAMLLTFGWRR